MTLCRDMSMVGVLEQKGAAPTGRKSVGGKIGRRGSCKQVCNS